MPRLNELEAAYKAMEHTIFGTAPAFGRLTKTVAELETQVNTKPSPAGSDA